MTRRGRVALVVLLVALLVGAFAVGRTASHAAAGVGISAADAEPGLAVDVPARTSPALRQTPSLQQTTVVAGETLWSVAHRIAPARDPRDIVAQLRRLNRLSTGGLQAGQQLLLPAPA